jgi:hypothetical protein
MAWRAQRSRRSIPAAEGWKQALPRRDLKWRCYFLRSEAAGHCHEDGSDDSKGYRDGYALRQTLQPTSGKDNKGGGNEC